MSTDELQQAADEARKQREALTSGTPPPDENAQPQNPDDSAQDTEEQDAPQNAPLPDFEKQFAEPENGNGETVEDLRRQLAEKQRELDAANVRAGSAAGRLKDRNAQDSATLQELRDRNAELEQQLAERDAATDDDNLDAEIQTKIDKRVQRALTPLQERFQKAEQETQNLHAQRDKERLDALHAQLADAVPDYCEIANSPKWMEFLKTTEPMTGTPFGRLAKAALDARDPVRLGVIFNTFKTSQGVPVTQNPKVRAQMRPQTNRSVTAPQEKTVPKVFTYSEFRAHFDRVESDPNYLKDPKNAALHEELKTARMEGRIQ